MGLIYRSPLRVYLLLGALGIWGIISGFGLSVSLFPMSNQTTVSVSVGYGSYASKQFNESVGHPLEGILQGIRINGVPVTNLKTDYRDQNVNFRLKFDWGANPEEALRIVETRTSAYLSAYEDTIRNSLRVNSWHENQGFFAMSFYSPLRSLDEIYQIMNPMVVSFSSRIQDAENIGLFNPNKKEITVRLIPERLAVYQLTTTEVERALKSAIFSLNAGSIKMGEKAYELSIPKKVSSPEQLENVRVSPVGQDPILLKDIATIRTTTTEESMQRFKTSGVESLILFADPKEGGNIKRMSDEVAAEVERIKPLLPADIKYQVIVNPSDFINNSIRGVISEVGMAAFLAVLVLFFFIGSLKNVITAAIEIPLSLVMAFIFMKYFGMNLNLISLGGLALSAGMNVDASVVVLENIFRHFEGKPHNLTYEEKLKIVITAVQEVRLPIIASTIASLVVFLPLVLTRGLTNALLGDLAKAVIFSHGLSAIVALILVPTIRLHLLSKGEMKPAHSPFEGALLRLETFYQNTLRYFLHSLKLQIGIILTVLIILPALVFLVIPKLKTEVIGKPDSDWLIVGLNSPLISTPKQMEVELEDLEQGLMKNFGPDILYTFAQMNGTRYGSVMMRLRDKSKIQALMSKAEETFKNTPTKFYFVTVWNPSELRIPEPPQFRAEIIGGSPYRRLQVAQDIEQLLNENRVYDKLSATPSTLTEKGLVVEPILNFGSQPEVLSRQEIAHTLRVATTGILVDHVFDHTAELPIYLRMPKERSDSTENLSSLPIGFEGRLISLGALAKLSIKEKEPTEYRENERSLIVLEGTLKKDELVHSKERLLQARELLDTYKSKMNQNGNQSENPIIAEVAADKELQEALDQLKSAILLSIALVFLTMVLQLGDIVHSLLVLVAIPLGFIGVISSLAIFGSSLSLNSGLGTILLNGIAVANSIILVDFIRRLHASGMNPMDSTVKASTARLRPILMTSLTTCLGMLPVALGMGEGGKTLQPLGIAVCGGLWVSTLLTLYIVPCLQYQYLSRKEKRVPATGEPIQSSLHLDANEVFP